MKLRTLGLLLASVAAEELQATPANAPVASARIQSLAQAAASLENQDLQEQMSVFHQDDNLPSDDEEDDDDDDSLIGQKAEHPEMKKHHHKQARKHQKHHGHKTMPDKGMEHVDVNHKDATTSSEDDAALIQEYMLDDEFDSEDEANFIEMDEHIELGATDSDNE